MHIFMHLLHNKNCISIQCENSLYQMFLAEDKSKKEP